MIVSKEGASTTVIEVPNVFRCYGTEYLQKFSQRMPQVIDEHSRIYSDGVHQSWVVVYLNVITAAD